MLEFRSITKRFAGTLALNGVSLTLQAGQILALVGENGAGKSTLIKILSGVHLPDSGSILLDGSIVQFQNPQTAQAHGVSTIFQEFSLVPYLNVVDNLFLGRESITPLGAIHRKSMRRQAQAILERLGASLAIDRTVASLSVAEQQLVEIAKALLRRTRILIMDEPTATLTEQEVGRLLSLMRSLVQQEMAIIFISHHLDEVFDISDRILCLRDGERVEERASGDWTREELIRRMVGRELQMNFPVKNDLQDSKVVLDVQMIQRKPHLPKNSFRIHRGEILGIAGLVGSGRTKMARALIGADRAYRQSMKLNDRPLRIRNPAQAREAGIGMVPEDRKQQGLVLEASVQNNMLMASWKKLCHPILGCLSRASARRATFEQIENLRIKTESTRQIVRTLSGGNQQKVVLAKWLLVGCTVLIFDEPTRGIDVGAKLEIYQLMRSLKRQGIAILLISSELTEVIGMSDRVMVMRDQRIEHTFAFDEPISEEAIMHYAAGGNRG